MSICFSSLPSWFRFDSLPLRSPSLRCSYRSLLHGSLGDSQKMYFQDLEPHDSKLEIEVEETRNYNNDEDVVLKLSSKRNRLDYPYFRLHRRWGVSERISVVNSRYVRSVESRISNQTIQCKVMIDNIWESKVWGFCISRS